MEFLDATLLSSASGSIVNAKSANASESDSSDEEDEQFNDMSISGDCRRGAERSGRHRRSGGCLHEADADPVDIRVMAITATVCEDDGGASSGAGKRSAAAAPERTFRTRLCAATSDGLLQYI